MSQTRTRTRTERGEETDRQRENERVSFSPSLPFSLSWELWCPRPCRSQSSTRCDLASSPAHTHGTNLELLERTEDCRRATESSAPIIPVLMRRPAGVRSWHGMGWTGLDWTQMLDDDANATNYGPWKRTKRDDIHKAPCRSSTRRRSPKRSAHELAA